VTMGWGTAAARRRAQGHPPAMRDFDPRLVEWPRFLKSAVLLTRHTFALGWVATLRGAWLVLRANQLWAPYPDNDPAGARRCMSGFYELVRRSHGDGRLEPARAAELEVEWWRVHRELQHADDPHADDGPLVDALASLYACVYGASGVGVRLAARERALAMRHSDRWVREGCNLESALVAQERAALVRSYAALLSAVHVP
jgi:hypothetical protein